jgi:two-component system, chemotaxis family, sensor kinase CheA
LVKIQDHESLTDEAFCTRDTVFEAGHPSNTAMKEGFGMRKKDAKIIQILNDVGDSLDSISPSDAKAWANVCNRLERVIRDVPKKKMAGLYRVMELCIEGVRAIGEKSASDTLSLSDALFEALGAASRYLSEDPDRDRYLKRASYTLERALGKVSIEDPPGISPDQSHNEVGAEPSLDDAASLLIQLDPDDLSGLAQLHESLSVISRNESLPGVSRTKAAGAMAEVEEIIKRNVADPEDAMAKVGRLLEEAMNSIDDQGLVKADANEENPDKPVMDNDVESTGGEAPVKEGSGLETQENVSGADREVSGAELDYMPQDPDMDLLGEFIAEAMDLVADAEEALLSLETDPDDMEAVGTVFRAFHTIKGNSAFLELMLLSEMAHHAESLLSRVRDREIRYSGGYADLSLQSLDTLKDLVGAVKDALGGEPLLKPEGYDELMLLLSDPEAAGISEEDSQESDPRIGDILVAQGKLDRESVEEATSPRIGDILVAQEKASRNEVEEAASRQGEKPLGVEMLKSSKASAKDVAQALRTQKRMKGGKKVFDSSIRVSTQRLDRLIDMVGELVIAHSMVAQDEVVVGDKTHDLIKKVAHSSKIVRELQDMTMSMRMIPLKSTFQKMARLVRDVARKVGKNVHLVTEGEDTEIDRNMVNVINDPLMHMVRNAVDHGVETPEAREASGKPANCTVKLSAYHSAGNVVVEIEDDGAGISRDVILSKARERGLISDGNALSDREVFNLIFEPGFSTAETVTDVSGRGVGMDVVKRNIDTLRGQVEIQSEQGKGSVFRMSLPLTLAIIDGMVVRVGGETYVIPTVSIVTSLKPNPKDLTRVLDRGEMLSLQGSHLIPLVRLGRLYGIEGSETDPEKTLVVVIENEGGQAGLVIDDLLGRQQVVIKSLGEAMQSILGISGGAIMPNGRVGLILDVAGLMKLANSQAEEAGAVSGMAVAQAAAMGAPEAQAPATPV